MLAGADYVGAAASYWQAQRYGVQRPIRSCGLIQLAHVVGSETDAVFDVHSN